jgi:hypothetical protein
MMFFLISFACGKKDLDPKKITNPDGPKTYGSYGSGSGTLAVIKIKA